ncbi:MAG: hypothetical protein ILP07_07355 [Treponema sp.]|nr:hypothetical protein [Treponema sp.]
MSSKQKQRDFIPNAILLMGFSLLALVLSMSSWTKMGSYHFSTENQAGIFVNVILGILLSLHFLNYTESFGLDIKKTGIVVYILNTLSYTLLCTAFFNTVLLPFSGIGILECAVILIYLFGNLICSLGVGGKKSCAGQSPVFIFGFGLLLMVFKQIIFYLFEDNIYEQLFQGNPLMRFLLFLASTVSGFMIFSNLIKAAQSKILVNRTTLKTHSEKIAKKIVSALKMIGKSIVGIFTTLLSGPVIIAIAFSALLIFGGFIIFFAKKAFDSFFNNVMAVIEPFMQKMLSTGKDFLTPSTGYLLCNLGVLLIFFVVIILMQNSCKTSLEEELEKTLEDKTLNNPHFQDANRIELKNRILEKITGERNAVLQIEYKNTREAIEKLAESEYRGMKNGK